MKLTLQRVEDTERAFTALVNYVFPSQVELLFAFTHRLTPAGGTDPGWSVFSLAAEFERQGALTARPDGTASPWRLCTANRDYRSVEMTAIAFCQGAKAFVA